jgi:hypothetical protein
MMPMVGLLFHDELDVFCKLTFGTFEETGLLMETLVVASTRLVYFCKTGHCNL